MKLSKKLKLLLDRRNLTQGDFAKLVNSKQPVVNRWLQGKKPSQNSIARIAKVLGVSAEDLLDENKNFSDINISFGNNVTQNLKTINSDLSDLKDKEIERLKKELSLRDKMIELLEDKIKALKDKKK